MEVFNFIKTNWEGLSIVSVTIATIITTFIKWRGIKSDRTLRDEYLNSFEQLIINLSSNNPSSQLTAAILLRRFFCIEEMRKGKDFLKDETINVISSLLRTLPTSVYQKTVGDGLAYAVNLSQVDLQKTNLQEVCLEGKKQKLILNQCDLYMADLSYALVKNVDAEGAYFYHSILLKTIFKNVNLKNADFRNSDLSKSKFENAELYMANFTGAINIPQEIKDGLEKYIEKDGNTSMRYMKNIPITTSNGQTKGKIFFSIPGCTNIKDNAIISEYKKMIEELQYEVICYSRDQYPQFGQLNKIKLDVMRSSAMIVFGLKQLRIEQGTFRPETSEEDKWNMKWINTPWNEIEVGLGAMNGLPILLVKDEEINSGIFDSHLSESFIATVLSSQNIEDVKNSQAFRMWISKIVNAKFNVLSDNDKLIHYMAQKMHEKWCQERISQGWEYGALQDDANKQHPMLISFDEIPESEKKISYHLCKNTLSIVDDFLLTK